MEQLKIKNFGGIEDLQLNLNKVNIFIGKQASGKSISAKLIYYFKGIIREFFESSLSEKTKIQLEKNLLDKFREYFPVDSWPSKNFTISYTINDKSISIKNEKQKLKIEFSESHIKTYNQLKKIIKSDKTKSNQNGDFDIYRPNYKIYDRYLTIIQKEFGTSSSFTNLFIPAGRSFFANLQSSIFSFLSNNKAMDPFLVEFGSLYENVKPISSRDLVDRLDKQTHAQAEKIIHDILGSRYIREKGKDFLIHNDKRKINVSYSSSGQQEILPLILILKALLRINYIGRNTSLFIEEPEAHLFPAAQKKVIELMGLIFNKSKNNPQLIVTTHSPYVLTSINNLVEAGIIANSLDDHKKQEVYNIIPEELIINSGYINAYAFKDGTAENIIDPDTGLIYATYLDSVSEEISIEFDKLLDVE